ncbi:hypothetical protein [Symbiopectobacterium purcellii]|uniref:Lysine-specific metallo-endopeptidase domain-containing protein n=1 Tax=Symbiopectobacterium purcellii TaxID=2871826 RepID=A0ABX9AN18_9ENTR|nr:hypothetical protein [Symbiopectobacterium purcellii]QZN96402.1 hypothetical protein K6K13_02735 [Symbiopectobacterium purcellii]
MGMKNEVSICDFLSSTKDKIPPIKTKKYLKDADIFEENDILYGQYTAKKGDKNCFNIIHELLRNPRSLKDNHICIANNINYNENEIVKITFNQFQPEISLCNPKTNIGKTVLEKDDGMKNLKKIIPVVFFLFSHIGAEAAIKIGNAMNVDKLLEFAKTAYKLRYYKFNRHVDYKKICEETLKILKLDKDDFDISFHSIKQEIIDVIFDENNSFFDKSISHSEKRLNISLADAELLIYHKDFSIDLESLIQLLDEYMGQNNYIFSEIKSIKKNSLQYMLECKDVITAGFSQLAGKIEKLHFALKSLDNNSPFNSYINNYFSQIVEPNRLTKSVIFFKAVVSKINKSIKEIMENAFENIYIASTKQVEKKSEEGSYFFSALLKDMSSFESVTHIEKFVQLPYAFNCFAEKKKKSIVFCADSIFSRNPYNSTVNTRKTSINVENMIIHELTHYVEDTIDFFYHDKQKDAFPDLEEAIKELSDFINLGEITNEDEHKYIDLSLLKITHPEFISLGKYLKIICDKNNIAFNLFNVKNISKSKAFMDQVRLLNADSLTLYIMDITKYVIDNLSSDLSMQ